MTAATARVWTVALLTLAGCGSHAPAGPRLETTTVAFSRDGAIWAMGLDGGHARRLVAATPGRSNYAPRLSPRGDAVAFLRGPRVAPGAPAGAIDVAVADLATGRAHTVDSRLEASDLGWAPAGRVAYSARGVIYTARADGSGRPARMADGGCPTWSHGGSVLVTCASAARSPSESVLRAGASVRAKLAGPLFVGGISPDDRSVLFSGGLEGGSDVYVASLSGAPQTRLVAGGPGNQWAVAWLGDGRIVVGQSNDHTSTFRAIGGARSEALPALTDLDDPFAIWQPASTRPATTGAAARAASAGHPGRLIRIDGRREWIECSGRGSPTVVLISGLGVSAVEAWSSVRGAVARRTRVCVYDRPGVGRSEPGTGPRTAARLTGELHALLKAAAEPGPYVLAGASFGGLIAQLDASLHPREVSGVVLVDSLHPDLDAQFPRVMGAAAGRARAKALAQNPEGLSYADLERSDREVKAARRFPDVPLIVLVHGISFDPGGRPDPRLERLWRRLQRENAARSARGAMIVARRSHHRIAQDEPALVVKAIERAVEGR